jgi:hypothetical protein
VQKFCTKIALVNVYEIDARYVAQLLPSIVSLLQIGDYLFTKISKLNRWLCMYYSVYIWSCCHIHFKCVFIEWSFASALDEEKVITTKSKATNALVARNNNVMNIQKGYFLQCLE